MQTTYLVRAAQDLQGRISSVVLNGTEHVPVKSVQRNGTLITVTTEDVLNQTKITNIKLLDEKGGLITERTADLDVIDSRRVAFTFTYEVKGR